jgi:MFS family permease
VLKFGYLFWCLPSGTLLQKFPIAKLMMVVQILWGFVLIGTGFANNFPTLMALRVLLGAMEAPIVPGNFVSLPEIIRYCESNTDMYISWFWACGIAVESSLSELALCTPVGPSPLPI